jgi:hypothetical protein
VVEVRAQSPLEGWVDLGEQPTDVNGQLFLPTGGPLLCPLVASKTAR